MNGPVSKQLSGDGFANALISGIHRVIDDQELLNQINVFPVPDGDTGTNLSLSLGAALPVLQQNDEKHLGTLLASVAAPLPAGECIGVSLPDRMQAPDRQPLVLNGMGVRKATLFKVKVYVAGLYLPESSSDAQAIIDQDRARHLTLHFVRDVDAGDIREAWQEGFAANAGDRLDELGPLAERYENSLLGKGVEGNDRNEEGHAPAVEDLCGGAQAYDRLTVNLADARFRYLEDRANFLEVQLLLVIQRQHQPFVRRDRTGPWAFCHEGQVRHPELLDPGDRVTIRKHEHTLRLLHPPGHDYYEVLRKKLRWSEHPS